MPAHTPKSLVSHLLAQKTVLVLLVLVPLIYHPALYDFTLLPKRFIIQLGLSLLSLCWIIDLHARRLSFPRSNPLYLPIALFLLINTLSTFMATNTLSSLVNLSHLLTFVCFYLLIIHLLQADIIPRIFKTVAGVGIAISAIGIFESLGVNWGILSNGRPSATFGYRNFAASYLIMAIPFTLCLWLGSRNIKELILGALSTSMMATFLIYTRTRSAWLGLATAFFIVGITLFWAKRRYKTPLSLTHLFQKRPPLILSLAIPVVCFLLALFPPKPSGQQSRSIDEKKVALSDALTLTSTPQSAQVRLSMWRHTLDIIRDYPIFGVGPGNWRYVYPPYDQGDLVRADQEPEHPHNDFLWIASETGILGLLSFLYLIGATACLVIKILKHPHKPEYVFYALSVSVSLLATLGDSMLSYPRELAEPSYLFWLGLGLLTLLSTPDKEPVKQTKWLKNMSYAMPVLLIGATLLTYRQIQFDRHFFLAMQYHLGKDFQAVLQEATAARRWGAFNSQVFFLQGDGYQSAGLFDQAAQTYREGLSYHPNAIQLLGALGTNAALRNQLDLAEQYYHRVLAIYPDYYQMYNNIGGIYQKRGDLETAIAHYQKAIHRDPTYIDAYRNLGLALLQKGDSRQAIAIYEKALKQTPDDPILYHELGDAYYQLGQTQPEALMLAYHAYTQFLKRWHGPQTDTALARQRIHDMDKRMAGTPP